MRHSKESCTVREQAAWKGHKRNVLDEDSATEPVVSSDSDVKMVVDPVVKRREERPEGGGGTGKRSCGRGRRDLQRIPKVSPRDPQTRGRPDAWATPAPRPGPPTPAMRMPTEAEEHEPLENPGCGPSR